MTEIEIRQDERKRLAEFLWAVYNASTHGASNLMERAIQAVENDDTGDPVRIADPYVPQARANR